MSLFYESLASEMVRIWSAEEDLRNAGFEWDKTTEAWVNADNGRIIPVPAETRKGHDYRGACRAARQI